MTTSTVPILRNEPIQKKFSAGQVIFEAGSPGDYMYGLVSGTVSIILGDKEIEQISEGGIFGELALVDANPRSARAVAKTDAVVAQIDSHRFMNLVSQNPWFSVSVMRVMAERLRRWGH